MRLRAAAVFVLALVFTGLAAVLAPESQACSTETFGTRVSSCDQELSWSYDPASRSFVQSGVVRPGKATAQRFEYQLNDRCGEVIDCGAAVLPCPDLTGRPGRMYQAWAFPLDSSGRRLPVPPITSNACQYPGRSVPLAVVEAAAHEEIRKRIPSPSVVSSPPGPSVVNLFTIFSTVPAAEQAITFTTPVPGEVRAVPEYVWDFGDGLTGVGPGRPFDPGVLPSKNRGYYLGATYAKPGSKHVTVTVTWRVTFRLEGVTSVPLAPIVMTASEDKPIGTAKAVLVR